MTNGSDDTLSLTFEEAPAELEALVAAIDGGDVDLDMLSAKVARAGVRLVHCRRPMIAIRAQLGALVATFGHARADASDRRPPEEPF